VSPDGTIRDPAFRRSRVYPDTNRPRPTEETGYRVAFEQPAPRPEITVGDLIAVRSNMREARREAVAAQNGERARALDHGLDTVTAAIEASLPDEAARAALRATDAQYRKFMTIEDAAARGGPESKVTAHNLHGVLRGQNKRAVVEGRAGELQDLAQAGAETFDQRVKPTGMRGPILAMIPKPGLVARTLNQPEVRSIILGEPPPLAPPKLLSAPPPEQQARALALAQAMRAYGRPLQIEPPFGVRFHPAGADEE
jgi:hypothetical protein